MPRHLHHKNLFRACMLSLALLLPAFTLPGFTWAAADSAMQSSLEKFFDRGVVLRGATAELIRVENWPRTAGALRWSLPTIQRGHPSRFSLIAQQGNKRWYVPVRVRWMANAIVMRKGVPARTLLSEDMMKRTEIDVSGHSGHWWNSTSELKGMRLNRPLAKGDVILTNHVKVPPMIKRGDLVKIVLDAGMITVTSEGKALRNARRGERVLIKNLRSREVIQAVAEERGVVRVSLRGSNG